MASYITILFVFILYFRGIEMMSESQMKSTAKVMRNVCQPKTKATSKQIDDMHIGIFEDDPKPKCYMLCAMTMMKAMKNGKLDYDTCLKLIPTLAPKFRESTRSSIEKCKTTELPDPCENAYQLAQCIYFNEPDLYFLP